MTQDELKEWQRDIGEAERTHPNAFANGALVRALFKASQDIGGASQQIGYLKSAIKNAIQELNENIKKADESSTKLARALNRLTFWGASVATIGVLVSLFQFLYANHLLPFFK